MTNTKEKTIPQLNILNQYIKDLSYENLQSINLTNINNKNPTVSIDMNAFFQPYKNDSFGVTLKVICTSSVGKEKLSYLEIEYFGLFKIEKTTDFEKEVLTNEASRILFPFVRSIISNITLNGGSIHILLDNVEFNK